jgi:hypothetical protein
MLLLAAGACGDSDGGGGGGGTNPFGKPTTPSSSGDKIADKGDIRVRWEATEDEDIAELAQAIEDSGLIEEIADSLNMTLRFPNDLTITHLDCGEENAFYLPEKRGVFLCYEMLKRILVTVYDERASVEDNTQRLVGAWMFVMFHELGHALIDQYKLPITGKEEDAVDDFSAVVLIEGGLSDLAVNAAVFWALADKGMYESLDFADEHSLNPQRFFNILCTVYGSDPTEYDQLVDPELLPASRAKGCPAEYQQKSNSWNKLLEPYAK